MTTDGPAWPDDPLRALLSFHGRIRAALKSLASLGDAAAAGGLDPMVARALYDFFTGPVMWHDVDEERSLMPRLKRVRHPPRVERLLERTSEAHERMETRLADLLPHLDAVAQGRETPDPERLQTAARELDELLLPHLRMEEQEIIPLARLLLSEADLAEMASEMAARLAARREEVALGTAQPAS